MSATTNMKEALEAMEIGFTAVKTQNFDGMKDACSKILAQAQRNIIKNKTTAFGQLYISGNVFPDEANGVVDVGFTAEHAQVVEFGRRAKKRWPPQGILKAWIRRKWTDQPKTDEDLDRAAFLVVAKIHHHGTKAQPFLLPAYKEIEGKIESIIKKYVK